MIVYGGKTGAGTLKFELTVLGVPLPRRQRERRRMAQSSQAMEI
jgi:hypothetical protein